VDRCSTELHRDIWIFPDPFALCTVHGLILTLTDKGKTFTPARTDQVLDWFQFALSFGNGKHIETIDMVSPINPRFPATINSPENVSKKRMFSTEPSFVNYPPSKGLVFRFLFTKGHYGSSS
jgi:hypothetical protein